MYPTIRSWLDLRGFGHIIFPPLVYNKPIMCPWQTNTSRAGQSSMKTLFLLDVTLGIESVHFNVSWKVNVRARSELSHFTEVCLSDVVVCEVERTSTRLLPTARTVLTLSVISVSACFLLLLRLRALQAKDEHTGKKTSLNDETEITLHTQTNTPATPTQHFLDLGVTSSYCPGPSVPNKIVVICAASHPVSLSVSLFLFCLSSPALLLLLLVFIVAAVCVSSLSRQQEDRVTCLWSQKNSPSENQQVRNLLCFQVFNQLPLLVTSIPCSFSPSASLPPSLPLHHAASTLLISL